MNASKYSIFTCGILVTLLLSVAAPAARAQDEHYEPFALRADMTAVRVWTSGAVTQARVQMTFNSGGYRIASVGPVVRQGNELSVDFAVERWTGPATGALVLKEFFFDLGALPSEPGSFTFIVKSRGESVRSVTFDPRQIVEHWEEASLERSAVGFAVWTAGGVTFTSVNLLFPDEGYRVAEWKPPARVGNDFVSRIRLERWTGRASGFNRPSDKRVFVLGRLPAGETFTVSAEFTDGVRYTSAPFTPAGQARPAGTNPTDDPAFFVRQHYLDFLGREPDAEGLTFWYNEITNTCFPFSPECVEVKRINVSAAFFLSIEFRDTGYFVYRLHKAAYGTLPRFDAFLSDTRRAAEGLVVGRPGWEGLVEENQRRFAEEFAARPEFKARYPETLTPEQYVDALDKMIAHDWSELEPGPLNAAERQQLAAGLRAGTETRGSVLRKVAGNTHFMQQERNRAFVLMQYFGYLRRNPDDAPEEKRDFTGYNFWMGKLGEFGGDFQRAEMVKAFINSDEYRKRFGQ
jgi:hypothetical protein